MNSEIILDKDWFVVKTLPRHEKKVVKQLENLNYTVFLPLQKTWRLWSDRKKKVELPLIPSVVFVQDCSVNKELLFTVSGVHSLLKLNGEIGRVRTSEIEQLKIIVNADCMLEQVYDLNTFAGEEVEIIAGPLKGYFAKAIEDLNAYRILIQINSLGVGYTVDVSKKQVRILK